MTVAQQNLQGKTDSEVTAKCLKENRILVTSDLDFADIKLYPPKNYPGFIVLRVKQ
jgi:predicted nuclease of predicted toxin-antitoxin system